VAVASARLYASLHLAPDNYASTPSLSFFTDRMPFLPPNQQHQSTEGRSEIEIGQEKQERKRHCSPKSMLVIAGLAVRGAAFNADHVEHVHHLSVNR